MFSMDFDSVICYLKERIFPPSFEGGYTEEGFIRKPGIMIRCYVSVNDYQEDKSKHEFVTFLFCGNTTVFARTGGGIMYAKDLPVEEFKNTSNHDSCWRTDGVDSYLSQLYFRMCREVNPSKAPADLSTFCNLNKNIDSVWITYARPERGNKNILKKVEARC